MIEHRVDAVTPGCVIRVASIESTSDGIVGVKLNLEAPRRLPGCPDQINACGLSGRHPARRASISRQPSWEACPLCSLAGRLHNLWDSVRSADLGLLGPDGLRISRWRHKSIKHTMTHYVSDSPCVSARETRPQSQPCPWQSCQSKGFPCWGTERRGGDPRLRRRHHGKNEAGGVHVLFGSGLSPPVSGSQRLPSRGRELGGSEAFGPKQVWFLPKALGNVRF